MDRVLIWDLPIRVLHWLMAAGFGAAACIALILGEHSPWFPYHSIIGLTLLLIVALRIAWGLIGSRYARFGSFSFSPLALALYLRDALRASAPRHAGHNPGSAYATYAMLLLLLGLGATGLLLGTGNESVKEVHEFLAYAMIAVIAVHLLGVALHTIRHRENITRSMIVGRKLGDAGSAIRSSHPLAAALFLGIVAVWTMSLVRSFDPAAQTVRVPFAGLTLRIGEAEGDQDAEGGAVRTGDTQGESGEAEDDDD